MFLKKEPSNKKIICIGTSTGGPRALQAVLTKLPKDLRAPVVIVQHMPPKFTSSLANRLDSLCELSVKEAENGEILKPGTAYIAPGGRHMTLIQNNVDLKIKIMDTSPVNGHRPSVDVLFDSLCRINNIQKIAVIMTGMGSDGTAGLVQLKKDEDTVAIAESQESCIVYGMPKSAIETNLVDYVVRLDEIATKILKIM
ncbi:CheB methylesterase domain-containing protein [Bacillus niameyensis]|uniref:CheB methylesterase domain-containing protein n=1 Tax=Bacillus niameyensis TaxID=1522308 RepID=UPI000781F52A|nr:CheB methylesterase domain-containing protein [Bacillus niameyensis]